MDVLHREHRLFEIPDDGHPYQFLISLLDRSEKVALIAGPLDTFEESFIQKNQDYFQRVPSFDPGCVHENIHDRVGLVLVKFSPFPTLFVPPLKELSSICKIHSIVLFVDNSRGHGCVFYNPFEFGADIILIQDENVDCLPKRYIACCESKPLRDIPSTLIARDWKDIHGPEIFTQKKEMLSCKQDATKSLANWLKWNKWIIHTNCLGLDNHPHNGQALLYTTFPHFGTNIVVYIREQGGANQRALDFLQKNHLKNGTKFMLLPEDGAVRGSITSPWINKDMAFAVTIEVGMDSVVEIKSFFEDMITSSFPGPHSSLLGIVNASQHEPAVGQDPLSPHGYIHCLPKFTLESGAVLHKVPVAYMFWGSLNEEADNVIVICHPMSGSARADDWWSGMVGPGKCLDTNDYFVICLSFLGAPYGTASPRTMNPYSNEPYRSSFPICTMRDTVRLHRVVLDNLGVKRIQLVLGGSFGGMQTIEWAFFGENYVRSVCPIAAGYKASAWYMTFHDSMRNVIYDDPKWRGGHYSDDDPPRWGLSIARCIAFSSYSSRPFFEEKCGRNVIVNSQTPYEPSFYSVDSYIQHHGLLFSSRFDALCYVRITQMGDTHDVGRGRGGAKQALGSLTQPALVVSIESDTLNPMEEMREFASMMPRGKVGLFRSPIGHNAFMMDTEQLTELIRGWFKSEVLGV